MIALLLVGLLTLGLLALGVHRPGWFALGAVLSAPLHLYRRALPDDLGPLPLPNMNVSIFRICAALTAAGLVGWIALRLRKGDREVLDRLRPLRVVLIVAALALAWVGYETWRSLSPLGHTSGAAYAFYTVAVVVIVAVLVLGLVSVRTVLGATALSAVLPLGYAVYQYLSPGTPVDKYLRAVPFSSWLDAPVGSDRLRGGGIDTGRTLFRPASFFSDPNFLAIFAVGTVILADPGVWATGRRTRLALQGLRLVALFVLAITASRTGLLVLAAYVLVRYGRVAVEWLGSLRARRGRLILIACAVAGAGVLALGVAAVASLRRSSGSASSHLTTIHQAVDLWWQFPLNGAGLANFGYVVGQATDRSSAQSFPFTILAEFGVIGLVIFGTALWAPAIRLAIRDRGLELMPLGVVFLVGPWFYDFPIALDVCAVWLALVIAAWYVPELSWPRVGGRPRARE